MGGKLIKQNLLLRWTIQLRDTNPKFIGKVFNGQSKETQSTYTFQIVHKTKPNLLFCSISPVDIQNRGSEIYLVLSYAIHQCGLLV